MSFDFLYNIKFNVQKGKNVFNNLPLGTFKSLFKILVTHKMLFIKILSNEDVPFLVTLC